MEPLKKSLSLCYQGKFDASEKLLKSLDQNHPSVKFNLGWHSLRRKDGFKQGYIALESGRNINVFGSNIFRPTEKFTGQDLRNKVVLLAGEGGAGDQIINIRFAKTIVERGARVIASCERSLMPLFKEIPYLTAVCDINYDLGIYHDYYIQSMSAPLYLDLDYKDIAGDPYLQYFSARELYPKDGKLKVGLKWSGNPDFEHEQYRRFPFNKIQDLLSITDINFYSLQKDNTSNEDRYIDLKYELKNWKDTAEIIMGLDLVISSCTSVAHLAAALGKPTWVIVPTLSYYVWALPGNKSPWYKTTTLYRQVEFENWDVPFNQIKKDLIKCKEYPECLIPL